jgi:hypothetical protein
MKLGKQSRDQLIWMPGHEGTEGNETADQLSKLGSECPLIEPEPACGISAEISKKAVRDWTDRGHQICWGSLCQKNLRTGKNKQTNYGG